MIHSTLSPVKPFSKKFFGAVNALMGRLIFIVGGARSGKSKHALLRAIEESPSGRVAFLATAIPTDEDMRRRIEEHRRKRPKGWATFEEPLEPEELAQKLAGKFEAILIDCLTLWLFNWFERLREGRSPPELEGALGERAERLVLGLRRAVDSGGATLIVVSNEVGMGVVPSDPYDRAFCDSLGRLNQLVAEAADEVILVCCGIPLRIKP
ncbi:MAG TPA: bifunctional adenosylcobinamide kinase/adenosylcobinamide-phosphate guanylyltransferase [Armatimonadetes bacterium]|nr:bifunctional adenosylcobinamide kinase/adenosylcobinamide-phosphate guanylyltransferase [Armatimonadota bacterium]